MFWSVLLGVEMGIILLIIVSTLEGMLYRCIWSVDEAKKGGSECSGNGVLSGSVS